MARVVTPEDRSAPDTLSSALLLPNRIRATELHIRAIATSGCPVTAEHRTMTAARRTAPSSPGPTRRVRRRRAAAAAAFLATMLIAPASSTLAVPAVAAADRTPSERRAAAEVPGRWVWPVAAPIRIISPFRAPPTPYEAGHRGIDVETDVAAPVVASAPGVVSFAGMVAGRPVVAIDHGGGVVSAVEPVAALVEAGATVAPGDQIGTVATGGHCGWRCLHFGVRIDGEYVSPFLFLGGLPRAVLLPSG